MPHTPELRAIGAGFGESLEFAKDDAVWFAFEFRSIMDQMELSSGWPVV
jgi:hypothetical protein